jgi:hypothetical protein
MPFSSSPGRSLNQRFPKEALINEATVGRWEAKAFL